LYPANFLPNANPIGFLPLFDTVTEIHEVCESRYRAHGRLQLMICNMHLAWFSGSTYYG
jgi:hypothetical protein